MQPPKLRPEKVVGLFRERQEYVPKKKFWPPIVDPTVHLQNCRSKLFQAEKALKTKRQYYTEQRVLMDEKWNEVAAEGARLKENFTNFNSFLITNIAKKNRAQTQLEEMKKFREEKEHVIEEITKEMATLHECKQDMNQAIAKYMIYENFLNNVLDCKDVEQNFKHVDNIVIKFENFAELACNLSEKQAQEFIFLQDAKAKLTKFIEISSTKVLSLHTQIAGLQGRFAKCQQESRQLEFLVSRIKTKSTKKFAEVETTKSAIWNLYAIMCRKRGKKPTLKQTDVLNQLFFISKRIKQYQFLHRKLKPVKKSQEKGLHK